jgi:hypothetical protein
VTRGCFQLFRSGGGLNPSVHLQAVMSRGSPTVQVILLVGVVMAMLESATTTGAAN